MGQVVAVLMAVQAVVSTVQAAAGLVQQIGKLVEQAKNGLDVTNAVCNLDFKNCGLNNQQVASLEQMRQNFLAVSAGMDLTPSTVANQLQEFANVFQAQNTPQLTNNLQNIAAGLGTDIQVACNSNTITVQPNNNFTVPSHALDLNINQ